MASITDTAGNAYTTTSQRASDTTCNTILETWYAPNVKAGATSVTVTMTTSVRFEAWALELSGASANPLLGGAVISEQPAGTHHGAEGPGNHPRRAHHLSEMTCGEATGLTTPEFEDLVYQQGQNVAYFVAPAPGSYGAAWNASNDTWCASTVAFK